MYHDQVVGFEQICRSMMSKEDGLAKILDFSMTYYVDGPHRIFLIITKRQSLTFFFPFFWELTNIKNVYESCFTLFYTISYEDKVRPTR